MANIATANDLPISDGSSIFANKPIEPIIDSIIPETSMILMASVIAWYDFFSSRIGKILFFKITMLKALVKELNKPEEYIIEKKIVMSINNVGKSK